MKSFVVYQDSKEIINELTDQQAGVVFKSLFAYANKETLPSMDAIEKIAFTSIKTYMDRNEERYERICERRREAGKKGGLANANKYKQMVANDSKCKQKEANEAKNNNDNKNKNKNNNDNKNKNDKERPILFPESVNNAFQSYLDCLDASNKDYDNAICDKWIHALASLSPNDPEGQIAIINQSIKNGWYGMFPFKGKPKPKSEAQEWLELAEKLERTGEYI